MGGFSFLSPRKDHPHFLNEKIKLPNRVIVAGDKEVQIKELVKFICNIFDYHNVEWLDHKPNGSQKRTSDKKIFNDLLPLFKFTGIDDALKQTIEWFKENYPNIRN